jgi:N-acetylglucosaminyldiphosphoundecaprenol N-acetyl-beta-D-mannosaminyltransferase
MAELDRVNILGVGVNAISMAESVQYTDMFLREKGQSYVCVTGVHGIMEAQEDDEFKRILNSSFLTTPDGMPTVWLGRWHGFRKMSRVYGPDFMHEICKLSLERGYRHFLYGGNTGVAEELASKLSSCYPGLQIVGTFTPPFRPLNAEEEIQLERTLVEARADVLWCGLSTPKQERFMSRYCGKLPVKLMVGVGAAFDINSGNLKDAPGWMKGAGLQWLFRLMAEPRRLAGRYLRNNPRFVMLTLLQLSGLKRYSAPTSEDQKVATASGLSSVSENSGC